MSPYGWMPPPGRAFPRTGSLPGRLVVMGRGWKRSLAPALGVEVRKFCRGIAHRASARPPRLFHWPLYLCIGAASVPRAVTDDHVKLRHRHLKLVATVDSSVGTRSRRRRPDHVARRIAPMAVGRSRIANLDFRQIAQHASLAMRRSPLMRCAWGMSSSVYHATASPSSRSQHSKGLGHHQPLRASVKDSSRRRLSPHWIRSAVSASPAGQASRAK